MRRYAAVICALGLAALSVDLPAQDTVIVTTGPARKGRILRDDLRGVRLRVQEGGGATADVEAALIVDVIYGAAPQGLGDGREMLKARRYASAAGMFQQALEKKSLDAKIKQYAYFYLAECQMRLKKYDDAIKTYEALKGEIRQTRFLGTVTRRLVDLYIKQKNYRKAKSAITSLAAFDKLRAQLLEGRLLEVQDQGRKAKAIYQRLTGRGGSIGSEAKVGLARVLLLEGNTVAAEREAQAVISSGEGLDPTVFAQAHLIIGNAMLKAAEKNSNMDGIKQALFSFLRVPMMYRGDETAEPEALFRAGYCFERLEKMKNNRREAAKWYSRTIAQYGGTEWAVKAKGRMRNVK